MWKVFLAFACHRFFLLAVILGTINLTLPQPGGHSLIPKLLPFSQLWQQFTARIENTPEASALREARSVAITDLHRVSTNPATWLARIVESLFGFPDVWSLLLVSNFFCLLFLWELYALLNRCATPDTAVSAVVFCLLWVSSYELSLGYSLSVTGLLMAFALRNALDNYWILSGLALFFLALMGNHFWFLLPALGFSFVYFQRHFQVGQVIKRACFVGIPTAVAVYLMWGAHSSPEALWRGGTLSALFSGAMSGQGVAWLWAGQNLPQFLTLVFFTVGMVASVVASPLGVHKLVHANLWGLWLATTPYSALASRAPLAFLCLHGIATLSSTFVVRFLRMALLGLTGYELFRVFSAG